MPIRRHAWDHIFPGFKIVPLFAGLLGCTSRTVIGLAISPKQASHLYEPLSLKSLRCRLYNTPLGNIDMSECTLLCTLRMFAHSRNSRDERLPVQHNVSLST